MNIHTLLKRSRKKARLTVQDMAYLLDYDSSNLSKYESGNKATPLPILLSYFLISHEPLFKFFDTTLIDLSEKLIKNATNLLTLLEEETPTHKVKTRMEGLEELITEVGMEQDLMQHRAYEVVDGSEQF